MGAHAPIAVSKLTSGPIARRERRPVSLLSIAVFGDGSTAEVIVLDLSYEGCGIESSVELSPGQAIKLSVLERGAIDATVLWFANGRAGLLFEAEPVAAHEKQPRIGDRVSLDAVVSMRRLGKANYRVRTTDVSAHGCRVELIDRPRIGEHMMVKFDGLEVLDSEVVWVEGFNAGLRFEKPLHPAVFDLLVTRLGG